VAKGGGGSTSYKAVGFRGDGMVARGDAGGVGGVMLGTDGGGDCGNEGDSAFGGEIDCWVHAAVRG